MTQQRFEAGATARALHPGPLVLGIAEGPERVEQGLDGVGEPLVGPARHRHDLADEIEEREEPPRRHPQVVDRGPAEAIPARLDAMPPAGALLVEETQEGRRRHNAPASLSALRPRAIIRLVSEHLCEFSRR